MAYTKIHAIKATVDKAIDYICNPEKTDEKMFVSSYACSPETAAYDFKYTLDHCRENSPNKAYHLIQAFAPGEVGFEEAHLDVDLCIAVCHDITGRLNAQTRKIRMCRCNAHCRFFLFFHLIFRNRKCEQCGIVVIHIITSTRF